MPFLVFTRGFLVRIRAIYNFLRETKLTSKVKISFTFYQKIDGFGADRDAVWGCFSPKISTPIINSYVNDYGGCYLHTPQSLKPCRGIPLFYNPMS